MAPSACLFCACFDDVTGLVMRGVFSTCVREFGVRVAHCDGSLSRVLWAAGDGTRAESGLDSRAAFSSDDKESVCRWVSASGVAAAQPLGAVTGHPQACPIVVLRWLGPLLAGGLCSGQEKGRKGSSASSVCPLQRDSTCPPTCPVSQHPWTHGRLEGPRGRGLGDGVECVARSPCRPSISIMAPAPTLGPSVL